MPALAERLKRVQVAASVAMTIKARELRAAGKDVISLTIGEPNFDSPPHAIEAAHQAALRGETKYQPQDGSRPLKDAIQRKFKRDSGLDFALDQIAVSNGGIAAGRSSALLVEEPAKNSLPSAITGEAQHPDGMPVTDHFSSPDARS